MINLRDKDKFQILSFAKSCFSVDFELWAFGSRIKGKSHDASDLDLVVKNSSAQPIPHKELLNFRELLKKSNIPIMIEVFSWDDLPEHFKAEILQNYVALS